MDDIDESGSLSSFLLSVVNFFVLFSLEAEMVSEPSLVYSFLLLGAYSISIYRRCVWSDYFYTFFNF